MSDFMTLKIRVFAPTQRQETDNGPVFLCSVEMSVKGGTIERDFPRGTLRLEPVPLRSKMLSPEYSQLLGEAIFTDRPGDIAFQQALAVAQIQSKGLRVCLQLDDDAKELHDEIQWERLGYLWENSPALLGITANTPFYRCVPNYHWDSLQPIQKRPIKVLVVMASPEGYGLAQIPHSEFTALHRLFDSLEGCDVTYLETGTDKKPTFENLQQELQYKQYHIVHFMCHGKRNKSNDKTILYLEEPMDGNKFVNLVHQLESNKRPLFCFLTACESGKGIEPLGLQLVRDGGLGATLAMTDPVYIATANVFVPHFYRSLYAEDGGVLDLAINKARSFIRDRKDWGVPVLFSRLPDNRLIKHEIMMVDVPEKKRVSGIPEPIMTNLIRVLKDCEELSERDSLLALFGSPPLNGIKRRIKFKDSIAAQVDALLGLLAERDFEGGQNALVLFLESLQKRYEPPDTIYVSLGKLVKQLQEVK